MATRRSFSRLFAKKAKPMEDTPIVNVDEFITPVEEVQPDAMDQVAQKKTEDRAEFNCPDCNGEGLKDEVTICPTCKGTGKV